MALSKFLSKLNWRLMLIHLAACWFFIYAYGEFFALHDYEYLKKLAMYFDNPSAHKLISADFDSGRFTNDLRWSAYSGLAGLLTAFMISLLLSIRHKWYWLNSVIVLLVALS
ncbi:MAG: hypothetical protein ACXVA2_20520 [Mucilaginibacter sp.]